MLKVLLLTLFQLLSSPDSQAGVGNWMETCPAGYVLVPRNTEYVDYNFCVMKYEAKARNDSTGVIDADGCNEAGCTTFNWGLATHSPASSSTGLPWRQISPVNALAECRSLGPRYDLISNAEWQTIARNAELVAANWTGGAVGSGCMFRGNSGETTCGYNGTNPEGGTGRNTRARLFLSNGQEVWDLAGNLTEFTSDQNNSVNYGSDSSIYAITTGTHTTPGILNDGVARLAKNQFGPSGTYGGCAATTCGFGYAWFTPGGVVGRGGYHSDGGNAGAFMVYNSFNTGSGDANNAFRCVFRPTDPCISGKMVTPGTRCGAKSQATGTQIFAGSLNGYDYFTTPGNCTDSATPTCNDALDTIKKTWRGSTGSNVNIPTLTNVTTDAGLSSSSESGAYSTNEITSHGSISANSAAHFCSDMNYSGFTDWFLPTKTEMSMMYCAAGGVAAHASVRPDDFQDCYQLGGKRSLLSGFQGDTSSGDGYWTATQSSSTNSYVTQFYNGDLFTDTKDGSWYVRCARREPSRDPCESGNPAIGTTCRGGALYAGIFEGGKYMVTPSGCTDSPTPICDGSTDSITKAFRGTTGGTCSNTDIPAVTNVTADHITAPQMGFETTPAITAHSSICANSAADYCENLVYGGYSDWYLPSKSELSYIYCNANKGTHNSIYPDENPDCVMSSGLSTALTGFDTAFGYWTSTERNANNAYALYWGDGGNYPDTKPSAYKLRCVRRSPTLAPSRNLVATATNAETTADATTASFTPRNNSLLVAVVGGAAENGSPTVTVSGGGLTWTRQVNVANQSSNYPSWYSFAEIWTAPVTTGASMTVTLSVNRFIDGKVVNVFEYTGHDTASPIGTSGTGVRDDADWIWTMTLAASPAITSDVISVVAVNNWDGTGSNNILKGSGWQELYMNGSVSAETQVQIQSRPAPTNNVVGWSQVDALQDAGANAAAVALEIKMSQLPTLTPPTFIQEAETVWNTSASPKTTASFNVQAGDVLVAYAGMENGSTSGDISVSGGGLTWTLQQTLGAGDGGLAVANVWTAIVDTNKSMTVTFTKVNGLGPNRFGGNVLTFRNSGGVGASSATTVASGAPSLNLTTTANSSAVVVFNSDWNAVDGAARAWRLNPTETTYSYSSGQYTTYGAYHPNIGAAGTYNVGLTAPGAQKYSIIAVEVKGQ